MKVQCKSMIFVAFALASLFGIGTALKPKAVMYTTGLITKDATARKVAEESKAVEAEEAANAAAEAEAVTKAEQSEATATAAAKAAEVALSIGTPVKQKAVRHRTSIGTPVKQKAVTQTTGPIDKYYKNAAAKIVAKVAEASEEAHAAAGAESAANADEEEATATAIRRMRQMPEEDEAAATGAGQGEVAAEPQSAAEPVEMPSLAENFAAAVDLVTSRTIPRDIMLVLYGLYQQAVEGDNNTPVPGFQTDIKRHERWGAWARNKHKTEQDAQRGYIALVEKLV